MWHAREPGSRGVLVLIGELLTLPAQQWFPCTPKSAAAARAFVADALAERHVDLETAQLLVSELAANAVRHAGTSFVVTLVDTDGVVRVEVADGSDALPRVAGGDGVSGGFGLAIVDALAECWGVESGDHGKIVWFELSVHMLIGRSPDGAEAKR